MEESRQHINIGTNTAKYQTFGPDSPAGDRYTPDGGHNSSPDREPAVAPPSNRAVFVVHGRDGQLRTAMFGFLRALDLAPLEWETLVGSAGGGSPFVGQIIQNATSRAAAAIVLLSPDDIVQLHPDLVHRHDPDYERRPEGQPRPNVLLELGMVLALYPKRTIIVQAGELRPVGDLIGRHVIRLDGSATPLNRIKKRLQDADCILNADGDDWLDVDRFASLSAYHRRAR
jgi:hypothetical protein